MNLLDKNISELVELISSDKISSEEIVNEYIQQIEAKDSKSKVYTFVDKESIIERAKELDDKRKKGELLGKLAGVPVAITEDISTKGIKTTAGSRMLDNYVPPFNATIIDKLLNEDAILLGKLGIGEFGLISSDSSAASVRTSQALFTLTFDSRGWARQSASKHGVFTIKPSAGLVSRYGVVSPTSSLGQVAVTGRNVEDLAYVLDYIVGYDKRDSASIYRDEIYKPLLTEKVNGLKIGLPKEFSTESIIKVAKRLEKLGAIIGEISIKSLDYVLPSYHVISSAEFSSIAARYDGISYGYRTKEYRDLEELYRKSRSESFGDEAKKRIMFGNFVISSDQYDEYYKKAQEVRTLIINDFDKAFEKYDLILSPISPSIDDDREDAYTIAANMAGLPAISIPCGIQLIGPAFSEGNLLKLAYSYEQDISKVDKEGGGQ